METNYSIVGKESQKLSSLQKVGIVFFILGIWGLIQIIINSFSEKTAISKTDNFVWYVFLSFGLQLLGTVLFTYSKTPFKFRALYLKSLNRIQKLSLLIGLTGFGFFLAAWMGFIHHSHSLYLWLSLGGMSAGIIGYTYGSYAHHTAGIKNNHVWHNSLTSRGILGWIVGVTLTLFYIEIYWFPEYMEGLIRLFDPLSYLINGSKAGRWFVYEIIYTFLIIFLGIKFLYKYRHNRYQLIRTISVIFFQAIFAFAIPHILESFNNYQGYFQKDLKNVWPLNYSFVESYQLNAMANNGVSGTFYFVWGIILFLVVTPFLTYLVGKRWYCSWVCGCGGLAETAGDGFRQLSSKKMSAWKIERWVIHLVMVFVLIMSVGALWPYFSGKEYEIGFLTITQSNYFFAIVVLSFLSSVGLFLLYKKHKNSILIIGSIILFVIILLISFSYFLMRKKFLSSKVKA